MDDHARMRLVEILHKLGLTEEMVRDHVILPDHVRDAVLRIELHNVGDGADDPSDPPPPSALCYRLNVQKLSSDLHDLLSGCLAGYSMLLRRYGLSGICVVAAAARRFYDSTRKKNDEALGALQNASRQHPVPTPFWISAPVPKEESMPKAKAKKKSTVAKLEATAPPLRPTH